MLKNVPVPYIGIKINIHVYKKCLTYVRILDTNNLKKYASVELLLNGICMYISTVEYKLIWTNLYVSYNFYVYGTLRHIFFVVEEENEMKIFSRLIFPVRTVSN